MIELARELTAGMERVLAPREVLAAFAASSLERRELGRDGNDEPIMAYSLCASPLAAPGKAPGNEGARGPRRTLWYGYPDPGEGARATGLVALLGALERRDPRLLALADEWHLIPCLNLADQPDGGHSIAPVMKTAAQEVDWCVATPRPETTALLKLGAEVKARHVFPLHDEFHCREPLAVYSMLSRPIATELAPLLEAFGYAVAGCHLMDTARDYGNSTFSVLAEHGLVFICEVSAAVPPRAMVAAQLAANLLVLEREP